MKKFTTTALLLVLMIFSLSSPYSSSQPQPRPAVPPAPRPRLEPIAEVKLIMEGFAQPNFAGLTKILAQKPTEQESWVFARGQALLVAESANLLMIRPPRTKPAQDQWMAQATELRQAARELGEAAANKDYAASRSALANLANQCNRCHANFAVALRVDPLAEDDK